MFIKLGTLVIAERRSIRVRDEQIEITLRDEDGDAANCTSSSGACTSPIKSKEIIFTLEFIGSVKANQVLYDQVEDYLDDICSSSPVQWQRRVCDETLEEYTINRGYIKRLEMDRERYGVRTGEVHLTTVDLTEVEMLAFSLQFLPPSITS